MKHKIWKGDGKEFKEKNLDDCSEKELQGFYNFCCSMLTNNSSKHKGKIHIINSYSESIRNCRIESLVRWIMKKFNWSRQTCYTNLRSNLDNSDYPLFAMSIGNFIPVPEEYQDITVKEVTLACLNLLGSIKVLPIPFKYLLNIGISLTDNEMHRELLEYDSNQKPCNRIDVIKKREHLSSAIDLHAKINGFTYKEFKTLLHLKSANYHTVGDDVLTVLIKALSRIQFLLGEEADKWKAKKQEILEVAQQKNFKLKEYECQDTNKR